MIIANALVRNFQAPIPQKVSLAQLIKPFREFDFILLGIASLSIPYGYYGPLDYLQVLGLQEGMKPSLAQYLIPILNAGSFFGRLFFGIASDYLGKANTFIFVCYLSGIFILAVWLPASGSAATITFAILYGISSAAYVSLMAPVMNLISPLPEAGYRLGVIFFITAVGGMITVESGIISSRTYIRQV